MPFPYLKSDDIIWHKTEETVQAFLNLDCPGTQGVPEKRHLMIEQTFQVVRQSLSLLSCFFNSQSYTGIFSTVC